MDGRTGVTPISSILQAVWQNPAKNHLNIHNKAEVPKLCYIFSKIIIFYACGIFLIVEMFVYRFSFFIISLNGNVCLKFIDE